MSDTAGWPMALSIGYVQPEQESIEQKLDRIITLLEQLRECCTCYPCASDTMFKVPTIISGDID